MSSSGVRLDPTLVAGALEEAVPEIVEEYFEGKVVLRNDDGVVPDTDLPDRLQANEVVVRDDDGVVPDSDLPDRLSSTELTAATRLVVDPGKRAKGLKAVDRHRDGAVSALDGLAAHLAHGYGVAAVGNVSDSTGANPGVSVKRWFWYLALLIVIAYPGVYVRFRDFDYAGTGRWKPPVVLNAPAGVTRVRWAHPGTSNQSPSLLTPPEWATEDLDVAVEMALVSWTPAAYGTIIGRAVGNSATTDWQFGLNSNGTLRFRWYQNAGGVITFSSSVPVPSPGAGVPLFVRVTYEALEPGYVVTFYTSPDGVTWTQLGAPGTDTVVKEIRYTPGSAMWLGSGNGGSTPLAGDYYEVWLRGFIGGPVIAPITVQNWTSALGPGVVHNDLIGGPQLEFFNGAWPGMNITDTFDNPTRQPHMVANYNTLVQFFNTSHNDNTLLGPPLLRVWDRMLTHLRAALPVAAFVAINQNPALPATTNMPSHPIRLNQLTAALRSRGVDVLNTFRMMLEDGRPWNQLIDTGDGDGQKHILDTGDFNPDAAPNAATPLNPQVAQALIVFNALQASPFAVRNPTDLVRS